MSFASRSLHAPLKQAYELITQHAAGWRWSRTSGVGGKSLLNYLRSALLQCLRLSAWKQHPPPCLGTSTVPCLGTFASALLGTFAVPAWDTCQLPAWERLRVSVSCLETNASVHALPGHACSACLGRLPDPRLRRLASSLDWKVCQCPAWARFAVPALSVTCMGTLARVSFLPGNECQCACPAWACLQCLPGTVAWSPLEKACQFSGLESLPVPCLGTFCSPCRGRFAHSLPWNVYHCPAWACLPVPACDACQFPACERICWDAAPCWALFLCLSDERDKRASAPLQVWNATHPVPCYFASAMNVKWRECKAKEKEPIVTSEGSGCLCKNERTRKRGSGGGWFAVVVSRSKWASVKAFDVMHAY